MANKNARNINSSKSECNSNVKHSNKKRQYKDAKHKFNSKRKADFDSNSKESRDTANKDEDMNYRNDPNWYIADLTTMEQAMGFSFDNFIGRDVNLEFHNTICQSGKTIKATDALGSIASLLMNPSPGYPGVGSGAKLSAVNQQGFKLYARLSSVNSKNTQYAPQDVTTLILAMGEVISMISHIQRAFGLLWTYNIRNRNMPKKLIQACGFDPVDLYANIAQYRIRFNTMMVQANKIPFPSNIDYFSKCAQLYSDVYKDSEDDMSQMYAFVPYSTWLLDETGSSEGTVLRTTAIPRKMGEALTLLENMLNTLLTSATYNYIYSDIINYLNRPGNSASLLMYSTIPDDYVVVPVYNYAMLGQITNVVNMSIPIGADTDTGHTVNNDVVPDMTNLCLNYAPLFMRALPTMAMDRYINFGEENPDVMTRIENTRYLNMALGCTYDETRHLYVSTESALSDHYCISINLYTSESAGAHSFSVDYDHDNTVGIAPIISDFDWSPLLYVFNNATDDIVLTGTIGDMKHFTTIDPSTMKLINELALYGLYEPKDFEYGSTK